MQAFSVQFQWLLRSGCGRLPGSAGRRLPLQKQSANRSQTTGWSRTNRSTYLMIGSTS